jgi:hypothetical protein
MLSYLKRRKQLDMSHPLTQESIEYNYAKHRVKISPVEASGTILLLTSRPYRHRGRGVGRASPSHTALSTDVGSASDGSGAATRPCQRWRLLSQWPLLSNGRAARRRPVHPVKADQWSCVSKTHSVREREPAGGKHVKAYVIRIGTLPVWNTSYDAHGKAKTQVSIQLAWSGVKRGHCAWQHGSFLGKCWATHDVVQWSGDRRHSSKHMRINLSVYENILSALWQEIIFLNLSFLAKLISHLILQENYIFRDNPTKMKPKLYMSRKFDSTRREFDKMLVQCLMPHNCQVSK